MARLETQIVDYPGAPQMTWGGYFHKKDQTVLEPNVLTQGSQNCFIPDNDVIVPRSGSKTLGQDPTQNQPIIGHAKKFTNAGGFELEVRVWTSDNSSEGDVIEVYYTNSLTGISRWYRITENVNPVPIGIHRYYFDEWFDTNLDTSLSLNLSRLIWVNGTSNVMSWTGGIGEIASMTATSISLTSGLTWTGLGFIDPASGGSGQITVNGVIYIVSSGWNSDTLVLTDTTGISLNDVAFDKIRVDATTTPFDFVRVNKNYAHYGKWDSKSLYISNAFNRPSSVQTINSQAVQNDLIIVDDSSYTGTGTHIYKVSIDSISPPIDEQTYSGTGPNDASFDTDAYSASGRNRYKVVVVGDVILTFANPVSFDVGEPLIGGTSAARARVFADLGSNSYLVQTISGSFEAGETVTGQTSGNSETLNGTIYQTYVQTFKNGNTFVPDGATPDVAYPFPSNSTVDLIDDITFIIGGNGLFWTTHNVGDVWELLIAEGGADTFQYQIDGGNPVATNVPITGGIQSLGDGVKIQFVSKTGHDVGDFWEIEVNQSITNAWINFYFTVPSRKPGEGNIVKLPSNFWTMAPQEDFMYVNTQHGQWVYIQFQLSSDLLSETVLVQPLKQATQNKVIYPYMIGHLDNNLVYVTENHTLDMIGRKELVELPQIGNLSDPVKLDFISASFIGGSIEFWDKKLWVTSPGDGIMFCFDWIKLYWQPPQVFQENGILSIVNDSLISHSNIRNSTNTLFVDRNDNGAAYTVRISLPYNSYGGRWLSKIWTMDFVEGYMQGNPIITMRVLQDLNGCNGIKEHIISPIMCVPGDRASLGKGYLGSHGLGNDPQDRIPYFQEIYKHEPLEFYYGKIELECSSLDQDWGILSVGLNAILSNTNNSRLTSNRILIQ